MSTKYPAYRDMTSEQMLAWGAAEVEALRAQRRAAT
jgi:hypothetical protein